MEVDMVANMDGGRHADMEVDIMADIKVNMVADIKVDKMADIKVDKMADIKVTLWLIWRSPTLCPTLRWTSLFLWHFR